MQFLACEARGSVSWDRIVAHVLNQLFQNAFTLLWVCHRWWNRIRIVNRQLNFRTFRQIAGRLWNECAVLIDCFQSLYHTTLLSLSYSTPSRPLDTRPTRGAGD